MEELPDVGGVITDAKFHLNHGGNTLQGPQLVGKAIGGGPLRQQPQQLGALLVG
jgi:hypothetical protein